jgi:hypothetical protein
MTDSQPSPRQTEPSSRIRAKSKLTMPPFPPWSVWFPVREVRAGAPHFVDAPILDDNEEDDDSLHEPRPVAPNLAWVVTFDNDEETVR